MGADGQSRGTQASLQLIVEVVPLVKAWAVDRTFSYAAPPNLAVAVGSLVRIPFGGRKVRGVVVSLTEGEAVGLERIISLVVEPPVAPPPMNDVLEWIAERYVTPRGVVFDRAVPPRVRVKVVVGEERKPAPTPSLLDSYSGGRDLLAALADRVPGLWCVQALPTHDHADLIAEMVEALGSGQALVAVPEVRWGSPVADRLLNRFPDLVRVDSSKTDGERSAAWLALAEGRRIGVGSRAIVYAPARDLGLLVLDDESNPTFKEDRSPRIDARRVAARRAAGAGICVMLADAHSMEYSLHPHAHGVTPSKEALREAAPNVEIVEQTESGVSPELHRAIAQTLREGRRVALLAGSGGYARSLWCKDCRRSVRCPRCETGVIYERSSRSARCPHCGFSGRAPEVCPTCGSTEFLYLGAGTERLEEQLAAMFPRARVARMDPTVLAGLAEAPSFDDADIYVTTWIGTKPAIRPPVDLVAVLDADGLLRRPDFRAAENGYLALVEMARWAGPSADGGRLVIQTREPSHHSIQAVARAEHRYFVEHEAEVRRDLAYPPYSELIRLRSSGSLATALMDNVREVLVGAEVTILGPVPVRVGESEVQEMLLKCVDAGPVAQRLRGILPNVPRGSTLRVDVDPR